MNSIANQYSLKTQAENSRKIQSLYFKWKNSLKLKCFAEIRLLSFYFLISILFDPILANAIIQIIRHLMLVPISNKAFVYINLLSKLSLQNSWSYKSNTEKCLTIVISNIKLNCIINNFIGFFLFCTAVFKKWGLADNATKNSQILSLYLFEAKWNFEVFQQSKKLKI